MRLISEICSEQQLQPSSAFIHGVQLAKRFVIDRVVTALNAGCVVFDDKPNLLTEDLSQIYGEEDWSQQAKRGRWSHHRQTSFMQGNNMTQPYPNQAQQHLKSTVEPQTIPDTMMDEAATDDIQLMVTLGYDHHRHPVYLPRQSVRKLGSESTSGERGWQFILAFAQTELWRTLEQHLTRFGEA